MAEEDKVSSGSHPDEDMVSAISDDSGDSGPYIQHDNFKEITVRAVILAAVLAVILGAANVYLGLLVGLTVSASIPASVISMAALQCFPDSNILENNIVQTAASAGEALAAGVIFTIPGLIILNRRALNGDEGFEDVEGWDSFLGTNYLFVTFLALFGGLIGILFSIPIRRALILEIQPPLKFPEGVATAQVLRAGETGGRVVYSVIAGGLLGATTKIFETIQLYDPVVGGGWFYKDRFPSYFGANFSSALLAVGYIVGPQVGTVLLLGALSQYFVAIPLSTYIHDFPAANGTSVLDVAQEEFTRTRYIGVGLMVIGGVWALISVRHALAQAIKFGFRTFKKTADDASVAAIPRYEQDISFKFLLTGVSICLFGLYVIFSIFSGAWGKAIVLIVIVIILAFLFSAVAAYMAGLLGSSNNPISGVTICSSIGVSGLILGLFGSDPIGPPLAVMVCCAIASACAISGDNIQDLKCGHILGATPWRQEVIMMVGVTSTSFVIAPILQLLEEAYTIGGTDPGSLAAPQANVISTIPVGIINGGLEWDYIGIGLGLGAIVIMIDQVLAKYEVGFRLPVLGFAVAFYLPIFYITPIFFGGFIHILARTSADNHSSEGVLYAAGLVAGDALTGILTAIPVVIASSATVLVPDAWEGRELESWPALIIGLIVLASLFYVGKYQPITGGNISSHGKTVEL